MTRKISFLTILLLLLFGLVGGTISNAQTAKATKTAPPAAPATNKSDNMSMKILNFQEDFVRGRSLSPDLLLQLAQAPRSLDSVIYFRKDFNDFHQVDSKSRPKFFAP